MIETVSWSIFISFLVCTLFLPLGRRPTRRFRRPEEMGSHPTSLREQLTDIQQERKRNEMAEVEKILSEMVDFADRKSKSYDYFTKKISAAIDYSIKRHDWYEDQRARLFQASLTLMTGVFAGIAIALRAATTITSAQEEALIVLGLITVGSVIRVIFLYNFEFDADRPYRLIGDIRFWFFRYNLPGAGEKRITRDNALTSAQTVANERKRFISRVVENADLAASIREDLEQVFELQVIQRYKSDSLIKLRWALSYFLIFASMQLLVYSVLPRILDAF